MNQAWSKDSTKDLIILYKERPELWNRGFFKSYQNKNLRAKAYSEISQITGHSVDSVKRKIHYLRYKFHMEQKKILKSRRRGDGEDLYRIPLWCNEQLKFIKEITPNGKGAQKLSCSNENKNQTSNNQDENGRLSSADEHSIETPTSIDNRNENGIKNSEEKIASVTLENTLASANEKEQVFSVPIIHDIACESEEEHDRLYFVENNNQATPTSAAKTKNKRKEAAGCNCIVDDQILRSMATKEDQNFTAYVLSLLSLSNDLPMKLQLHRDILNLINERLFTST